MIDLERLHMLSDAELEAAWADAVALERAERSAIGARNDARARRSHEAFHIADEIKRRARGDRA